MNRSMLDFIHGQRPCICPRMSLQARHRELPISMFIRFRLWSILFLSSCSVSSLSSCKVLSSLIFHLLLFLPYPCTFWPSFMALSLIFFIFWNSFYLISPPPPPSSPPLPFLYRSGYPSDGIVRKNHSDKCRHFMYSHSECIAEHSSVHCVIVIPVKRALKQPINITLLTLMTRSFPQLCNAIFLSLKLSAKRYRFYVDNLSAG